MSQLTLEDLDRRISAVEAALGTPALPKPNEFVPSAGPGPNDWMQVVGMFRNDPVFEEIVAEGTAIREAEREAARREVAADMEAA